MKFSTNLYLLLCFCFKLELDGRVLHLPDIEGVVILNIPSWGGGCQPWGTETENGRLAVPRLVITNFKIVCSKKMLYHVFKFVTDFAMD